MVTHFVLPAFLAFLPWSGFENELAKTRLVGTWRVVGNKAPDGTITKDDPGYTFVITRNTISLKVGREIILQADYRVDVSKNPHVMYYTFTRAPCLCGASPDREDPYSLEGNRLIFDTVVLERQAP